MNKMCVISIVVPVYKVEEYLDRCVRSLIEQTYPNLEIILVDDGSPDGCPAMCDAYAKEDSRVRVIHKTNGGLSDARNVGMDAATGDYVMFVDSDDYIASDACERIASFMKEKPDILIGDGTPIGGGAHLTHGGFTAVCSGRDYLKKAVRINAMPMAVWLYVFRRDFLNGRSLRFKVGITHEDEEFTPRAFLEAESVVETGICFYNYVIRDGSITMKRDLRKNAEDLYETCLSLEKRYHELEDKELMKTLLDSLVIKYLTLFQRGRLFQYGKEYIHKSFVKRNAYSKKTRLKAMLYTLSPSLYWHMNDLTKKFK